MDEHIAIARLSEGEIDGLEWIVNQFKEQALRVAYLITGDAEMAEDVTQDAFLTVYRSIYQFDRERQFRPWFMRIVTNLAVQAAQKSNRNFHGALQDDVDFLERIETDGPTVEDLAEKNELTTRLWEVLQSLSPRQRQVIVQRYYLEMSEKEMSSKMGIAPGTINWLLNTARKRLLEILKWERTKS